MTPVEKILARCITDEAGCVVWLGGKARGGYGKVTIKGKTYLVHRYVYLTLVGNIPSGLQLDHLCRNRACCNPSHLEPVTCKENLMRGNTLQRANVEKTHCPKGHEYTPENTYRYPDGRRRCIACRRIADNADGPKERRKLYKRRLRAGLVPDPDPAYSAKPRAA